MSQRTKNAIIDSFKDLLNKRSLDKITVKDICEKCDLNRQTFYYYYMDIMDLLKAIIFEELSKEIAQNRTLDTWKDGFLATMNYLKRHSKMVLHIYHSSYWPEINLYCRYLSNRLLNDVIEECAEKTGVIIKEKDQIFMVTFYRLVFNGLIIDWINEGMQEEPEDILNNILKMITGSISRSLLEFTTNKALQK